MTEPLTRTLSDKDGRSLVSDVESPDNRLKPGQATPEDEAAAADPLGRTSDGPTAHNRDIPPGADHGGRDLGGAGDPRDSTSHNTPLRESPPSDCSDTI